MRSIVIFTHSEISISVAQIISDLGRGSIYISSIFLILITGVISTNLISRSVRVTSHTDHLSNHLESTTNSLKPYLHLCWSLWTFWVFGAMINQALKHAFSAPRPWWIDSSLSPLAKVPASGYGMPSGHAQSAVGVLLILSYVYAQRPQDIHKWFRAIRVPFCVFLLIWPLAISWSRVHLNEHSLSQVLLGLGVGSLWMYIVSRISFRSFDESPTDNKGLMSDVLFLIVIELICFVFLVIHLTSDIPTSSYPDHQPALTLSKLIGLTLGASTAPLFLVVWLINWKNIRTHI